MNQPESNAPASRAAIPDLDFTVFETYLGLEAVLTNNPSISSPWWLRGHLMFLIMEYARQVAVEVYENPSRPTDEYRELCFERVAKLRSLFPKVEELGPFTASLRDRVSAMSQDLNLRGGTDTHYRELSARIREIVFSYARRYFVQMHRNRAADVRHWREFFYGMASFGNTISPTGQRSADEIGQSLCHFFIRRELLTNSLTVEEIAARCDPLDDECAICVSSYDQGHTPVITLACKHIFGKECLTDWLDINKRATTCPMCRTPLAVSQAPASQDELAERAHEAAGQFWHNWLDRP
ncbi:hypothetical protein BU16DRAFT_555556 [Lophium mytilinum]|uniref:RING-type domain-containing protein n=1 Tax=Lophium mytilinum TaxID=390894 RepID=A0A6A6RC79_9PEZI|nr:hypothetical protein BU16DRAFT_555556 [Lophium mytilinum]